MPSAFELLQGRKPRSHLSVPKHSVQCSYPESEVHQYVSKVTLEKKEEFNNKIAGPDKPIFNNIDLVWTRNTLKHIWELATVLNRPNLMIELRTYLVEMRGKVYQRTAEHTRPRSSRINLYEPVKDTPMMQSLQRTVTPITTPQVTPVKKITSKFTTPKLVPRVTSPSMLLQMKRDILQLKSQTTRAEKVT